jgi:hypothetical protein
MTNNKNFPFDEIREIKNRSKFDSEYYVMGADYAEKYPMLNWGSTRSAKIGFFKPQPVDTAALDLPLQIVFDGSPKKYEMADFLMLGADYAGSEKLKQFFEQRDIYGVQFIPVEVNHKKNGDIVKGYFAMKVWNVLPAVDKNNYEGGELDRFERITNIKKFSLDTKLLESIPLEKRLVFYLHERSFFIIHQSIYEALQKENFTGVKYFRVDEWDSNVAFR